MAKVQSYAPSSPAKPTLSSQTKSDTFIGVPGKNCKVTTRGIPASKHGYG